MKRKSTTDGPFHTIAARHRRAYPQQGLPQCLGRASRRVACGGHIFSTSAVLRRKGRPPSTTNHAAIRLNGRGLPRHVTMNTIVVDDSGEGHGSNPFVCNVCQKTYGRIDHLARHFRSREYPVTPSLLVYPLISTLQIRTRSRFAASNVGRPLRERKW